MIRLDCLCASTRRASRLVTRVYSQELGSGMEPSQFLLLSVLSRMPGCTQVSLGAALGYDKTTLSRGLKLMEKNGWIRGTKAEDHREHGYRLTAAGKAALTAAAPRWRSAQDKMRGSMSAAEWESVWKAMEAISRVAAEL